MEMLLFSPAEGNLNPADISHQNKDMLYFGCQKSQLGLLMSRISVF